MVPLVPHLPVRTFRSPYGSRWPLIPRRIGLYLQRFRHTRAPYPPSRFYKWPSRTFARLFTDPEL